MLCKLHDISFGMMYFVENTIFEFQCFFSSTLASRYISERQLGLALNVACAPASYLAKLSNRVLPVIISVSLLMSYWVTV